MSATTTLTLGGGFGGISAANSLRRLLPAEHELLLIDNSSHFHVGAGKTWMMLGERTFEEISQPRAALLEEGVQFVHATVLGLDLSNRTVSTDREIRQWDHLVIALGADLNPAKVAGLVDAAHTFYTVEGAQRLRTALEGFTGGDIAIVIPSVPFKCPPAPYEAALLLHHEFERRQIASKARIAIYTVEGAPMTTAGPEMGQYIRDELVARSVAFHPQKALARVEGTTHRVLFADGSDARYDLLIAIPPHEVPRVVRDAELTNEAGWIPVDGQTLHVQTRRGAENVYAVGDVTAIPLPGRHKPDMALSLPKAGVFAEANGRVVAHQIAAKILDRAPGEIFDGKGYCYLETGGGRALKAEGSFFALPNPIMEKRSPDEAQFRDKLDWVARQLRPIR